MRPELPIEVDADTGVWTTDGLPMLYVPRHFFTNNHIAVEAALGRDRYSEILYPAGYKSAFFWCEKESKTHGLSGLPVFEHYLKRLSQRGWGRFSFLSADVATGNAEIALKNSSFVLQQPGSPAPWIGWGVTPAEPTRRSAAKRNARPKATITVFSA
jgi:hypothetical protein